ncbi:MAG: hypothetical protein JNL30_17985 [Rubrivivax sp.]|nr:hypothetical protein [Rubrivivax sp.]
MSLATRTQALLDIVERERARQCDALLGDAERAAQAQRENSRAEARRRLHEAFSEERTRSEARLAAARADLRTRQRAQAQRHLEAMLALAWQRLPQVLAARWQAADSRRAWLAAALADARAALPAQAWHLTHAAAMTDDDRAACQQAVRGAITLHCDERLGAGLRIGAGGNVLDATLAGLLADRADIGGRLVGALETPRPDEPGGATMAEPRPARPLR